ncbi:MAG TPA: exo-alpha-sialidase [Thermoplasmata archaeon]|nr:exo-alpha-sialidase [Thermoplasmata archaeon]
MAVGPSGDLFVAWEDSRNGDFDIYFARSPDGGLTWSSPDYQVNSDTGTGFQWAPAIAVNASGTIYLAWEDGRFGGGEIYFARSIDGGVSWSTPNRKINDATHPGGAYPSIAVTPNGTVVLAWAGPSVDPLRSDFDIYTARSTSGGQTWSPTQQVNTDSGGVSQYRPSLAVGPAGDILLAWSDNRGGGALHTYTSRSMDEGQTWTDPNIRVSPSPSGQDDPAALVGPTGLGAAWIDSRNNLQIFFATSADGTAWSETFVSDGGWMTATPSLAADGGTLYLVWQEDPGTGYPPRWEVHFSRSDDGGVSWTPDTRLPDAPPEPVDQQDPTVAVSAEGMIYVGWMDHRHAGDTTSNYDGDIYFARSMDGGQSWTTPSTRVSDPGRGAAESAPLLRVTPDGVLHLLWEDRERRLVIARSTDGGSTWSPSVSIAPEPDLTDQIYPDMAVGPGGSLYALWQGHKETNWGAYFARSMDGGLTWTSPAVALPWFHSLEAAIAVDWRGNVFAAAVAAENLYGSIQMSKSLDGGLTWSSPATVDPGNAASGQSDPRLAVDADGTVYAVWVDGRGGDANIRFSRSDDGGETWSLSERLNRDNGTAYQYDPVLAVGPPGEVYVGWADERGGNPDIYLLNSSDGGRTWPNPARRVNDEVTDSRQEEPSLVADRHRGNYVAWRDSRNGNADIRFAKVDPLPNEPPSIEILEDSPDFYSGEQAEISWSMKDDESPPYALHVVLTYEVGAGPVPLGEVEGAEAYTWRVPDTLEGQVRISVTLTDEDGAVAADSVNVTVRARPREGFNPVLVIGVGAAVAVAAAVGGSGFLIWRRRRGKAQGVAPETKKKEA